MVGIIRSEVIFLMEVSWVMGLPQGIIHFRLGFSTINHPAMGVPPWLWKPPCRNSGDSFGLTPMAIHGVMAPLQEIEIRFSVPQQTLLQWPHIPSWYWCRWMGDSEVLLFMLTSTWISRNIWIFAENWKWSPWVKYHHSPTWWFSKHPNHQLPPNHHWFPRGKHPFSTGNTGIPCSTSPRFSRRSCARKETELSWQSALRATSAGSISSQGLKGTKLKSMSTYLEMNVKCVYHVYIYIYRSCIKPITISWFQAISRIRCGYNNQPC